MNDYSKLGVVALLTAGLALYTFATVQAGDAIADTQADVTPVDVVITNAKIFVPQGSDATAIAIKGEQIAAIGSQSQIERLAGATTTRIDAHGGLVTPGFNDAHVHFLSGSLALKQVDLAGADSLSEVQRRIREFAQAHKDHRCIVGRGWVYGTFEGGLPHKAMLDEILPDRPAVMKCYDGHTLWVNSAALSEAGITRETPDPLGGVIVRQTATGEPTGVLKETAQTLVEKIIPVPTRAEKLHAIKEGIAAAHRVGVTSVREAGVGLEELSLFDQLRATGELPLRFTFALEGEPRMGIAEERERAELKLRFPQLNIDAIKLYVDGVIEAHTAAMLAPYANRPTQGLPKFSQAELNHTMEVLDAAHWQVMVHAIGDAGIRMTLDAIEHAQKKNPLPHPPQRPRRHRLEHIETISQADIARLASLNVIASMQPYHANPNGNIFNVWAANLGSERASRAWAWKSLHDAGARLALGSDWPVVGIDPRLGIHTALTRQTLDGKPASGFLPQQRLPLPTVIEAYTAGSAFAEFAEDSKGTLVAGMLADIVIWNKDLLALPVDRVHTAEVTTTLFNGRVVYRGPASR